LGQAGDAAFAGDLNQSGDRCRMRSSVFVRFVPDQRRLGATCQHGSRLEPL